MANKNVSFNNGILSLQNRNAIIDVFTSNTPTSNQILKLINVVEGFQLAVDCAGSFCTVQTAPTNNYIIRINKNGITVATIDFQAEDSTGVFANTSLITFNIGDQLSIVAPGTVDPTIAGIAVNLKGTYI